jgi:tRNA 5-methylaminomethyl-2-thiouridine biosynthesis bifunctional protein
MSSPLELATLVLANDGTPYSPAYGDVYHSAAGGHLQAKHVFMGGNGLPERWRERRRFVVLETGFGLGTNFLATWLAWRNDPQRCAELHFISLEKHPFAAVDLARAHEVWPEFAELSAELMRHWPVGDLLRAGEHRLELADARVVLHLLFGDALAYLPMLDAEVDAFYLDGFSPAKNPDLWSPELCRSLHRLAVPGATLATWSVAGAVRRALSDAGFVVEKRAGFADKRQMLIGRSSKPSV